MGFILLFFESCSFIQKINCRFGQELRDKTKPLAQYPELGRPGRLPGIRELVVHPNYIVFYRELVETRTVQILRVRHDAQQVG